MSRKLITVDGSDLIAEVSEVSEVGEVGEGFWVTIAYLGSSGLLLHNSEWKNFVELVNKIDGEIK